MKHINHRFKLGDRVQYGGKIVTVVRVYSTVMCYDVLDDERDYVCKVFDKEVFEPMRKDSYDSIEEAYEAGWDDSADVIGNEKYREGYDDALDRRHY